MRRHGVLRSILLSTLLTPFAVGSALAYCSTIGLPADRQVAELQTNYGQICIELLDDPGEAPGHVENFLWYLDNGHLEGTFYHRLAEGFVLQGADLRYDDGTGISHTEARPGVEVTNEPCVIDEQIDTPQGPVPVCGERGNEAYTVALAKLGNQPDSGTTSWFFNLGDNRPNLDNQNGGFTVFGRVLYASSREVVDAIAAFDVLNAPPSSFGLDDQFWIDHGALSLNNQQVPVQLPIAGVSYDPEGCTVMDDLATVLQDGYLNDPLYELHDPDDEIPYFLTVSAACGTPIDVPLVDFVPQAGPPSCPDLDRVGVRTIQPSPAGSLSPAAQTPLEYVSFSCEQLESAVTTRDDWRTREQDDFFADFTESAAFIESAIVRIAVPEPTGATGALAALATIGWLRRRRHGEHPV